MNFPSFILVTLLALTATNAMRMPRQAARQREQWESSPLLADVPAKFLRQLRAVRQNVTKKGCTVNVCFALQGGDFITDREYDQQKDFVELMVRLIEWESGGNFCAVQYGRTTRMISPLTERVPRFVNALSKSEKVDGMAVNIGVALGYAAFQLRTQEDQPRKLVIMGDGLDNIGPEPMSTADGLREEGVDICAVAVGSDRFVPALAEITDDVERVMMIKDFDHFSDVIVALVNAMCQLQD